ncbi:MAG: hypothetical protein OJF49_003277 [Ktedonobacterales bacterium]|nr:MAG: hypothetical protein OJF49_003277 [Ktedonobacterales bacterium]
MTAPLPLSSVEIAPHAGKVDTGVRGCPCHCSASRSVLPHQAVRCHPGAISRRSPTVRDFSVRPSLRAQASRTRMR